MELINKEDVQPICPHCQRSFGSVFFQGIRGLLGRRYIYYCSHCHKVLGVSHRKGFWMG